MFYNHKLHNIYSCAFVKNLEATGEASAYQNIEFVHF
jgi:hypothetical protein